MTIDVSPRKVLSILIVVMALGLSCVAAWQTLDVAGLLPERNGDLAPPLARAPVILGIDPDALLKGFIDQRGQAFEGDELTVAIRRLDDLIMAEARAVHLETGSLVIKSDLVLAGSTDYTAAFLDRVVRSWDAVQ